MAALELATALDLLERTVRRFPTRHEAEAVLLEQALGRVAAQEVLAAGDHPAVDQALRDGVAFHDLPLSAEMTADTAQLPFADASRLRAIVGTIYPGAASDLSLQAEEAALIMTGAGLPAGAHRVAMAEDLTWWRWADGRWAELRGETWWGAARHATHVSLPPDAANGPTHVLARGAVYRQGDSLVKAGDRLNPVRVGLLASAGQSAALCSRRPRVAVLTTGDELISAGRPLAAGQIYNSNGPLLAALLHQVGVQTIALDHVKDDSDAISSWLRQQLGDVDLVITTGAVSAGQKDQLPSCFQRCGVETIFHGVKIKPGKPVFLGRWQTPSDAVTASVHRSTWVLGLPGNPISVWVTWQLFGRRLMDALVGLESRAAWLPATLERGGDFNDARLTFWPGRLKWGRPPWDSGAAVTAAAAQSSAPSGLPEVAPIQGPAEPGPLGDERGTLLTVTPLAWNGSPDLRSPAEADCLIYFPAGGPNPPVGSAVWVWLLPS